MSELFRYIFQNTTLAAFMLPAKSRAQLNRIDLRWWISLGQIIAIVGGIAFLGTSFQRGDVTEQPVIWLVVLLMAAGIIYLGICEMLRFFPTRRNLMTLILVSGALLRLFMASSPPILEVDFNRYLWDGAVSASGENPYEIPPAAVADSENPVLQALFRASGKLPDKINHGHLTTIYPPLSEAFFALAYWIKPFSLTAWKIVIALCDLVTVILIFALLRHLGRSPTWAAVYWVNPLLAKEIFNSAHMDILLFPFLLGAILATLKGRHFPAMLLLAGAVAIKIWPLILAPLFLRAIWPRWGKMLLAALLLGIVTLGLMAPLLLSGLGENSGLATYGETWHNNDSLHKLIWWGYEAYLPFKDIHPGHARDYARKAIAIALGIWVLFQAFQYSGKGTELPDRVLLTSAGLFLLSPTQFPWYAIWLTPLLALQPRRPLLALTALMPIYYLRFYFDGKGQVDTFENWVVWLEYLPVWIWILAAWWDRHRMRRPYSTEVAVGYETQ